MTLASTVVSTDAGNDVTYTDIYSQSLSQLK